MDIEAEYTTRIEASKLANVTTRTIDRMVDDGTIESVKMGHVRLISRASLNEWIESRSK